MLHDGQSAWVVDPGDADPVFQALAAHQLRLEGILVTHHHPDHTAGVAALRLSSGAQVYGPYREKMPEPLRRVGQDDTVDVLGLTFQVLEVPGHTNGHIAYFCAAVDSGPILFCGDTLFSGGCGRLFEGTPPQMLASLEKLAALPGDTRVCCTHEYTLSNLRFALEVEPGNADLVKYQHRCLALREAQTPTLPSTITTERAINPFLRSNEPEIAASARRFDAALCDTQGVFATLRTWKNQF